MIIIETQIFTRQVQAMLSDEEYRFLQAHLINRPDSGKIIPGSGGLRKLRWPGSGFGKRGGFRVIYYWFISRDVVLLLLVYSKSERDDLTSKQLRQLKKVVDGEFK